MKRTRYCGDVKIELEYLGYIDCVERDRFFCRVTADQHVWQYSNILVDPESGDDVEECFAKAASEAVHCGSKYNIGWDLDDGCIPDWAPPRDIAQAINDAASVDDQGYVISRHELAAIPQ
jgi:hypothetical protein